MVKCTKIKHPFDVNQSNVSSNLENTKIIKPYRKDTIAIRPPFQCQEQDNEK